MRSTFGFPKNTLLIGVVARFNPVKDYNNLILALAHMKNRGFEFNIVMVGKNIDTNNRQLMANIKKTI